MKLFNLIFKHKSMTNEQNEQAIDEAVPEADGVFRDKPADVSTEDNAEDTGTIPEDTTERTVEVETETDPDPEPVEDEKAEPLYQKKVYIVDLNNIGLKIEGEGSLIVDVMSVEDGKATVKNGDLTMEVPKEFLF